MDSAQIKTSTIFAPAKINLYLHVTGRLDNGYHTLDSLVAFADVGDQIHIEAADDFEFSVDGPYKNAFGPKELDASPHSSNLVVQAAWALSRATQKKLDVRVKLTKNLPVAAGIGGGSSDAAAIIWGLLEWWGLPKQAAFLPELMLDLGADTPVCFTCTPLRMQGIGEILEPAPSMEEIAVVLVNPGKVCMTADVFRTSDAPFENAQTLPDALTEFDDLIDFLSAQKNSLQNAAISVVPEIGYVLSALEAQKGCALARLSGSGATCFGLFEDEARAKIAAGAISKENPDWWVTSGWLNRIERY